jgi:hypothetical protein
MQVKLIVVEGNARKREVIRDLPLVIGRSRAAGVTIGDPKVSRQHCFLEELGGMVMLRDNGSLNGTLVDGQKVTGEAVIRPGAKLTVGPLTFVVIYEPTGEGVQSDTGQMLSAGGDTDGGIAFEALVAGAGMDDDSDPDNAMADAGTREGEEPTLQWLPPPAASGGVPSFLPPLAAPQPAGEAPSSPKPKAKTAAPPAEKATTFDWLAGAGGDAGEPVAEEASEPQHSEDVDGDNAAPAGERAPGPGKDADDRGTDDRVTDDRGTDDREADDREADDRDEPSAGVDESEKQKVDEEIEASAQESTVQEGIVQVTDKPSAGTSGGKKEPKKKRSWWPFGKKKKAAAAPQDKPSIAPVAEGDDQTGSAEEAGDEAIVQKAAEEPAEGTAAEAKDVKKKSTEKKAPEEQAALEDTVGPGGDTVPTKPAAFLLPQPPADAPSEEDDDQAFNDLFKGLK